MQFVVSVFEENYIPFLIVCLGSIIKNHYDDKILVIWNNISSSELNLLAIEFPSVEFKCIHEIKTKQDSTVSSENSKIKFFFDILSSTIEKTICFIECDSAVYKNLNDIILIQEEFDFLLTADENNSVNIDIAIIKKNDMSKKFLNICQLECEKIIKNNKAFNSNDTEMNAIDNQVISNLINYKNENGCFPRKYSFGIINFKIIDCKILNNTNIVPINAGNSCIFRFSKKEEWHKILLEEKLYYLNKSREIESYNEMYTFWINYYMHMNDTLIKKLILDSCSKNKNILNWSKLEYNPGDILFSEILVVLSLIKELHIDILIIANIFKRKGNSIGILFNGLGEKIKIISIEQSIDDIDEISKNKSIKNENMEFQYFGEPVDCIEEVIKKNPSKKIAILVDGNYDIHIAGDIFLKFFSKNNNIVLGFFHNLYSMKLRKAAANRLEIQKYFDRIFFTDDHDYVDKFKELDSKCILPEDKKNMSTWTPNYIGWDFINSYGPTMAVIFPAMRDKVRYIFNNKTKMIKLNKVTNPYGYIIEKNYNFTTFEKILDAYAKYSKNIFFIEIGANDGASRDPINKYIVNNYWSGILVEPIPSVFNRLVENYSKCNNKKLNFENCAISNIDGEKTFYYLKSDNHDLQEYLSRLSSFNKDVILYHNNRIKNIEKYIVTENIKTLTFNSLVNKYNVSKIDVIVIDAEGYDFEIIQLINFKKFKPDIIYFENGHLTMTTYYNKCLSFLESKGYFVIQERFNSIALLPHIYHDLISKIET